MNALSPCTELQGITRLLNQYNAFLESTDKLADLLPQLFIPRLEPEAAIPLVRRAVVVVVIPQRLRDAVDKRVASTATEVMITSPALRYD